MIDTDIKCLIEEVDISSLPPDKYDFSAFSEDAVLEALWASQGNMARASRLLEVPYAVLHHYLSKNEKLRTYLRNAALIRNDLRCDLLEDMAFVKALAGESSLIWKLLCTYGKLRGYGDFQKIDMNHTIPVHVTELLNSLKTIRQDALTKTTICDNSVNEENKPA
jgi:hypothetical protein